jgi:ABC-2 family transporter
MNSILFNVFDNPILLRELRRRMRGKALIYSINTYLFLMAISTGILLLLAPSPFAEASFDMLRDMQITGERIYYWITTIQVMLVLIVAPTITAGMTTGEKERQTFDFLRVTTITRWMYVMGCFLSTAFYVALALICALPMLSLTFLYGGVTLQDVVKTFFFLLGSAWVLSSFGLFVSSVCERTRTAQGIIVFLIFALMFGGFLLYSQVMSVYQGAIGSSTSGASEGIIYFFNLPIPTWLVIFSGLVAVTFIFLLLAARKLFEPQEARAFAHWQFTVLMLVSIFGALGILSANPFTSELPEIAFFALSFSLLLVAVHSFAIGRVEVGDEIWHLKRLFPLLRPFDQTIPFLLILATIWYFVLQLYPSVVKSQVLPAGLIDSLTLSTISAFAFFCVFARTATALSKSRGDAMKYTLIAMVVILIVIPIVASAIGATITGLESFSREFMAFSPFVLLGDGFFNPQAYSGATSTVGIASSIVYIVLAVLIGLFGEIKRYLRWKDFDYHYDMPSG